MSTSEIIPQQEPHLTRDEEKLLVSSAEWWSDPRRAYATAKYSSDLALRYRKNNHDRRFWEADKMFVGWTEKKTWEGTKMPRASMPVFMLLTQIMGMMPKVIGALFPDNLPFDVEPRPGTQWEWARAARDLLRFQISDLGENEFEFATMRQLLVEACQQELQYGNLVIEPGWCMAVRKQVHWEQITQPIMQPYQDPQTGQQVMVPTGEYQIIRRPHEVEELINKPIAKVRDIREFFIDPNCPSPNVQRARFCGTLETCTVAQLKDMAANDERIQLPEDDVLLKAIDSKESRPSEQSKAFTETFRGNSWQPQNDETNDPNLKNIQFTRFFTKDRQVWLMNGHNVPIYNQPGEGFFPFVTHAFIPVPGRWYGLSAADLCEGDQKLAQELLSKRLDELNLIFHPPIIRRRGAQVAQSQNRFRPGAAWEVDGNPKDDIIRMEMGNVTAEAFVEYNALDQRVQKTLGVTDLGTLGVASASGNAASRTATGVAVQAQASEGRMTFFVQNLEDQVVIPLLSIFHTFNKRYLDEQQAIEILGPDAQFMQIDPMYIKNCNVHFIMHGSTKMRSRPMLVAGGLQQISAFIGQLAEQMMAVGKVPNIAALSDLVADTFQLPRQALFVDASPEQMQMMNQPSPDKVAAMEMQRERLTAQGAQQASRDDTELMKPLVQGMNDALVNRYAPKPEGDKDKGKKKRG